jgi:hypothetical protein
LCKANLEDFFPPIHQISEKRKKKESEQDYVGTSRDHYLVRNAIQVCSKATFSRWTMFWALQKLALF